ncbi:MAG: sulfotransferase domain-containing protein [Planctomycetes bacterium]|nr:sulfotransferase domain-containing protein [Planctomycetota bacterium]
MEDIAEKNLSLRFVLIIGAMKCATTSLFHYLSQHPEIAACSKKELNFFNYPRRFAKGFQWYLSLWNKEQTENKLLLEGSPGYTMHSTATVAENIRSVQDSTGADFKFVYVMRDPVARFVSHYKHVRAKGKVSGPIAGVIADDSWFVDTSRYASHLDEYYKRFDAEDILLVLFEDILADPAKVLRTICSFLEIDATWPFEGLSAGRNPTRGMKFRLFERRVKKSMPLVARGIKLIPKKLRLAVSGVFSRAVDASVSLSSQERKLLLSYLKEDLLKLKNNYGVDTSRWNIDFDED